MKRILMAAAALAVVGGALAGCVTATPYQPAPAGKSASGYGYSDFRIDSNHWRVSFAGNSMTSRETVEKYLLYRAAELTLEQGADWFEANHRGTERKTDYWADTDPFYHSGFWGSYGWGWRPYWGYGGPWGWRTWDPWYGDPFWTSHVDIREVSRYEATAEISMGKGPKPGDHRVFDAHEIVANLGPTIVRPQA